MKTATLGDRIEARMLHLGLSREHVAAHVGVTGATVHNWRNGHNAPQLQHLTKLCEVLECSIGYLLRTTDKVK